MICSMAELALGDDHSGILVLPADTPLGADFVSWAGLRDVVYDVKPGEDETNSAAASQSSNQAFGWWRGAAMVHCFPLT